MRRKLSQTSQKTKEKGKETGSADSRDTHSGQRWGSWIILPACASLLLLAITNQICQNIAVAPFLWILPLSLYLISFIICFDRARWYDRRLWAPLFLASTGVVLYARINYLPILWQVVAYSALLLAACMLCHGELAKLKPPPEKLTLYFLLISVGGALGGLCVSIIEPLIFTDYWELYFGLVFTSLMVGVFLFRGIIGQSGLSSKLTSAGWYFAILIISIFLWNDFYNRTRSSIDQLRNFYGTLRVVEEEIDQPTHRYKLYHGDIVHGMQFTSERRRFRPTTYYGLSSGINFAIRRHPKRIAREKGIPDTQPMRIGTIGLGVGTVAAYGWKDDLICFYEIDPDVKTVAEKHFSYLKNCQAKLEFKIGDARTLLEKEPPQNFDVLVVDAFSRDAIPVHLITTEAFRLYLRYLNETGILAIHVSNKYLDLKSVVIGLTKQAARQLP